MSKYSALKILIVILITVGLLYGMFVGGVYLLNRALLTALTPQIEKGLSEAIEGPVDLSKEYILPELNAEQKALEVRIVELMKSDSSEDWESAAVLYLDGCETSPKTGYNALLSYPKELPIKTQEVLLREFEEGGQTRKRCVASVLAKKEEQQTLQQFWRNALDTNDVMLRWWGIIQLGEIGDVKDLEDILRQYIEVPQLHALFSTVLRKWNDRRAVPCLLELSQSPNEWTRKRANKSLQVYAQDLNGLEYEQSFEKEIQWWNSFKQRFKPVDDLLQPWEIHGKVVDRK